MAANKTVTVIPPRGPGTNIKVTVNTTILQVLEEASKKYNLNPDEYDLRHHKQILDVNLIFRHANIANFAKLEMVPCKTPRKVSNVKICIQLENGERKENEYLPDTNVQKVLSDLNVEYNVDTAVIIYLQREIPGKEFDTVTLKSLGLASGRGLFRLIHRDQTQSKEQAHVYVPPMPKVSKVDQEESRPKPVTVITFDNIFDPISIIKAEKGIKKNEEKTQNEEKSQDENTPMEVCSSSDSVQINSDEPTTVVKEALTKTEFDNEQVSQNVDEEIEEPKFEFLGERQALLFNPAAARAIPQTELPDEFFEHNIHDARILQRDIKRKQEQLIDAPLITAAQRQLEKDKEQLKTIHKYKKTIIRIHFPNQLVLQGTFKPLETVQTIKDFIKIYLDHPEIDFVLYTTPPRCNLDPEKRLLDVELVPTANIYYSGNSNLKSDIQSKLSDPTAAHYAATKTRLTTTRNDDALLVADPEDDPQPSTSAVTSTTMKTITIYEPQASADQQQSQKPSKVPKWFKMSTK